MIDTVGVAELLYAIVWAIIRGLTH